MNGGLLNIITKNITQACGTSRSNK